MRSLCLVLLLAVASPAFPQNAAVSTGACGDKDGLKLNGSCVFAIMNSTDFESSLQVCGSYGGSLASLKTRQHQLNEFLRLKIAPREFCSFWVDGLYTEYPNKSIQLSNNATVDLGTSWRFLYPRSSEFRTRVVYDVWDSHVSKLELLEGFRNVPEAVYNYILCEIK